MGNIFKTRWYTRVGLYKFENIDQNFGVLWEFECQLSSFCMHVLESNLVNCCK
jgi:hypothetical protein